MKYLEVVSLDRYQHYQKGRETIWIKVYLKIVRDYRFQQLNNSERWLFIGVIMMAVECSNSVPYDALWVRDACCYSSPNSVQRVSEGLAKMVKLGLFKVKNAITERKIIEDKKERKTFSFKGQEAIKEFGKWYIIEKGGKILFTGNEKDIIEK